MTVLTARSSRNVPALILRWTARLTSLASIGTLLAFLGPGEQAMPTMPEATLMAFFPFGVMAGMVLGWWKELHGGLMSIASLLVFSVALAVRDGQLPMTPWFAIFTLPGFFFVAAAMAGRSSRST